MTNKDSGLQKLVDAYRDDFDRDEAQWYHPDYVKEAKRLYVKWCLEEIPLIKKHPEFYKSEPLIYEYLRK